MFTDVSGFTAMSERLDPEDVHALMDRAFEVILAAVHGYEGTINQFLGDGVMALFGAPIAHEDHAGRALRAALAIQEKLAPIRADVQRMHGRDFLMRIGINTGLVVVGAIGRDLRMDYTALGDTVNLASRLLNVAQPGQIVASRHTKELCEGFFVFEDLGDFQVKGKTEPQRAYAVKSELGGRTRLEVSKERGLTPLIGRAGERERLAESFRRAAGGPEGSSSSRASRAWASPACSTSSCDSLDGSGHLELETTCASFGRAMAYRPMVELYRRYFDLPEELSPEDIRRRIAARLVALGVEGEEPAFLLHHFLGLSVPQEFLCACRAPSSAAARTRSWRTVIFRESALRPVVIVVENMHWIDASSEELLKSLGGPSARPRGVAGAHHATGSFPGLAPQRRPRGSSWRGSPTMTSGRWWGHSAPVAAVSEPLFQLLVAKSGGNPLYVEEIVRQLQETEGIVVENGEARLRAADVTVPETIRDIIAARVDRLAESPKQTLQVASVVGRRFGVSLVSHVREAERDQVAGDLKDLHAVDFVFPSAHDPELMYSFKHALTQEVVYTSLLERRRRRFHAAAGRGLEELYASRMDDVVEILAYHFGRGQVWDKALTYQRQAAAKAQARSAHREAVACLEEALEALRQLPETPETREQEIDVRLELRGSLYPLGEFEKMLGYSAGSRDHGPRDLRFAPARVGLHPHRRILPPDGTVRRGASARRGSAWPGRQAAGSSRSDSTQPITSGLPATPSVTTGAPARCCESSRSRHRPNGGVGAFGGTVGGSWAGVPGDHPRLARALSGGARGIRRGRRRRPPGGGPRRRARQPLQSGRRLHRVGILHPRQGRPRRCRPRARAGLPSDS